MDSPKLVSKQIRAKKELHAISKALSLFLHVCVRLYKPTLFVLMPLHECVPMLFLSVRSVSYIWDIFGNTKRQIETAFVLHISSSIPLRRAALQHKLVFQEQKA